jgi:hypothetical protein
MDGEESVQHFKVGDLVLVINADYNPGLIGHAGTIARPADRIVGYDKFGQLNSGIYVVVDLPDKMNKYGTTLWYKKPEYLVKISPDDSFESVAVEEKNSSSLAA